jgi:hypothetical protein
MVEDIMIILDVATTLLYTGACFIHEVAYSDVYSNKADTKGERQVGDIASEEQTSAGNVS